MNELAFMQMVQEWVSSPPLRAFSVFCARGLIVLLTAWVLFLAAHRRDALASRAGRRAFASGCVAFVLAAFVGMLVGRLRPFVAAPEEILRFIEAPSSVYAFPSRHAAISFAMAFGMLSVHRRRGAIALVMAFFVGFGRVAVGVHYPTDILGGAVLALGVAWCVSWADRRWLA